MYLCDMHKISIVGAGWLGLPLGKSLLKKGHVVKGSTTREEKLDSLNSQGLESCILRATPALEGDIASLMDSDLLVVTLPPRQSEAFYQASLSNLIEEALKGSVSKVIYSSATSVYPNLEREVTEEDAALCISRHSGVRLLAMENLFRDAFGDRCSILRFGGLFGPGRQPCRFLSGRKGVAGGQNPVNMVHLDDCVGVIEQVIGQNVWGQTFNVVNPDHPSREEFYRRACAQSGSPAPTWSGESRPWKQVSSAKVIHELGYKFGPLFP